jgi:hypothetical protein
MRKSAQIKGVFSNLFLFQSVARPRKPGKDGALPIINPSYFSAPSCFYYYARRVAISDRMVA